jgi:hypothetical protein
VSAVTRHLRIIENRLTVLYAQRDVLREVLGDDRPKVLRPRDAKATYGIIAEVRRTRGGRWSKQSTA